jgi:hypothetical protein
MSDDPRWAGLKTATADTYSIGLDYEAHCSSTPPWAECPDCDEDDQHAMAECETCWGCGWVEPWVARRLQEDS